MQKKLYRTAGFVLLGGALVFSSCNAQQPVSKEAEIVLISEVEWQQLNPLRGAASPQAGTLWGDRNAEVPTGFLAKFVDGFSSPPHIHNAIYRAVVISGSIHNDDPDAGEMWMPVGSFWTQPEGQVHITAAKGETNIALVEIDMGPYLVLPKEQAYDNGERPINVDVSNIVWVDLQRTATSKDGPKIAYLWGDLEEGRSNGSFLKLPAGFKGAIESEGTVFRAVVIEGQLSYDGSEVKVLDPGSYFSSQGEFTHAITSHAERESVIYIRTNGRYAIDPSLLR